MQWPGWRWCAGLCGGVLWTGGGRVSSVARSAAVRDGARGGGRDGSRGGGTVDGAVSPTVLAGCASRSVPSLTNLADKCV